MSITYTVSVENIFTADSPQDAVRQMVAWLDDHAGEAGYRVDDPECPGRLDLFIDAELLRDPQEGEPT